MQGPGESKGRANCVQGLGSLLPAGWATRLNKGAMVPAPPVLTLKAVDSILPLCVPGTILAISLVLEPRANEFVSKQVHVQNL